MFDQKNRDPAVSNLANQIAEPVLFRWVHAGGGLVEEQQLRHGAQSARYLESPLIAIGEVLGQLVRKSLDAAEAQDVQRLGLSRLLLLAVGRSPKYRG